MSDDLIRYDVLAQEAMRGVVRKVMTEVAQTGLPGDHHFFVTFNIKYPGVRVSSRIREQYPDEMTIVLQHQFWDLNVTDTTFEVGLSFNSVPERLLVPFRAITAFVDPHANFGLKLEAGDEEGDAIAMPALSEPDQVSALPAPEQSGESDTTPQEGEKTGKKAEDVAEELVDETAEAGQPAGAEVVSLDAFRKKNG